MATEYGEYNCDDNENSNSDNQPDPSCLQLSNCRFRLFVACFVKESLIREWIQVETKDACFKVGSATNDIKWISCRVRLLDLAEINFKCSRCLTRDDLRISDVRLEPCKVWQVLEITEVKRNCHHRVIKQSERSLVVLGDIGERNEFGFFDDISVLVAYLLSLDFDKTVWIDSFALNPILNSVWFGEVEEIAWTVAWDGVEIVWAILELVFASLVEHRISNVEVALLVGGCSTLEVRLSLWADAYVSLHILGVARVRIRIVRK